MNHRWAIVLGGASCVWDDVREFEAIYGRPWDGLIIAVNDIAAHWPGTVHHWVSLHPVRFKKWKKLRQDLGRRGAPLETWGADPRFASDRDYSDHVLTPWLGGSSGMLGVQVAKKVGCSRAILCGVPITPTAHFAESEEEFGPTWGSANVHWPPWPRHEYLMRGWVRSMSGRTQELLGRPTRAWLQADKSWATAECSF